MLPFFFRTGTIGVAQSLCCTLVRVPSASNLWSSSSTFVRKEKGTVLALTYFGLFSLSVSFAVMPFTVPTSSTKTSLYLSIISLTLVGFTVLMACVSLSISSQVDFFSANPCQEELVLPFQLCIMAMSVKCHRIPLPRPYNPLA